MAGFRHGVVAAALAALCAPDIALASGDSVDRARIEAVTRPATDFTAPERYERRPGGAATSFATPNRDAFSHPSANMPFERKLDFEVGDGVFVKIWVSSPSSTRSSDGLGPLFNARSCQSCHVKDGRGRPPVPGDPAVSMVFRLSAGTDGRDPDPVYGGQLQNRSVQGVSAEGRITAAWEEIPVRLADGGSASLRWPRYGLADLRYGLPAPDVRLSPRTAPPMIGVGLLEAVPEADILARADPDDRDSDGISGRPNLVWSDEHGRVMLGRFGWKAGQPTLVQQAAAAFRGDIGISTPLYPTPWGDCTERQAACRNAPHGDDNAEGAEARQVLFDLLAFYTRNLAVPARRGPGDPQVLRGKRLFYESGCTACHTPKFVTGRDSIGPEQSFQLIWPYTDLLLHDMGPGLADNRPEGDATGREWRTAPLWGIGLTEAVNGHSFFLHDGRARGLLEAVLWHGGEAEAAKQAVVGMTGDERDALLAFLRSL
ncbi:MAG: c-type cytochrome [Alphaproteobacteria bacterium]|nr:c-type cytochrome [Alphaproteobacteria bacterium]